MRRFSVLTATAMVSAGLVAGCGSGGGGSSSGGYCSELKSSAASIKSFTADSSTPDFSKFDDFIDKAHDLADKAPSEIEDDWKVLLGAMDTLTDALEDAGIKMEDMGKLMSGQIPDGVDATKVAELGTKLQEVGSDKVTKASEAINKHAKDECKVDLEKLG